MATEFTWEVDSLHSRISDGYVTSVRYTVAAVDGEYRSATYGSVGLSGDLVIPYASLTESHAIGWVQNALGQEVPEEDEAGVVRSASARKDIAIDQIESSLQEKIDQQRNPVTQTGVPWSTGGA